MSTISSGVPQAVGESGDGGAENLGENFRCAISYATLIQPVTLACGHNYSLQGLVEWIGVAGARATCPICRAKLGGRVISNLKKDQPDYNRDLEAAIQQLQNPDEHRAPKKRRLNTVGEVQTLSALTEVYRKLDCVRDDLQQALMAVSPPQVIVFGPQSAGKSSVLERLAMRPIFPRGTGLKTKVAVHVRLRWSLTSEAPTLEVKDTTTGLDVQPIVTIPCESADEHIAREMKAILERHNSGQKIVDKEQIIITIRAPDVPSIDLIDLPGINAAGKDREAALKIFDRVYKQNEGCHGMFLYVAEATTNLSSCAVFSLVDAYKIQSRTLGIFTKVDMTSESHGSSLLKKVQVTNEDEAQACEGGHLDPYGWIAVCNKQLDVRSSSSVEPVTMPNYERIHRQAKEEVAYFQANEQLKEIFAVGRGGAGQLLSRLSTMFRDNLLTNWVPQTMTHLQHTLSTECFRLNMLGIPAASEDLSVDNVPNVQFKRRTIREMAADSVLTIVGRHRSYLLGRCLDDVTACLTSNDACKNALSSRERDCAYWDVDHLVTDDIAAEQMPKAIDALLSGMKSELTKYFGFAITEIESPFCLASESREVDPEECIGHAYTTTGAEGIYKLLPSTGDVPIEIEVRHGHAKHNGNFLSGSYSDSPDGTRLKLRRQSFSSGSHSKNLISYFREMDKHAIDSERTSSYTAASIHRTRVLLPITASLVQGSTSHPPFQVARFPAFLKEVFAAFRTKVDESMSVAREKMKEAVAQFFVHPCPWLTISTTSNMDSVKVLVQTEHLIQSFKLILSRAARDALDSLNVECILSLTENRPNFDWVEGCAAERAGIIAQCSRVSAAHQHVMSLRTGSSLQHQNSDPLGVGFKNQLPRLIRVYKHAGTDEETQTLPTKAWAMLLDLNTSFNIGCDDTYDLELQGDVLGLCAKITVNLAGDGHNIAVNGPLGTFVNGVRIALGQYHALRHGDYIAFGSNASQVPKCNVFVYR
mmetsp:Transcript_35316/g.88298  ORF Transcript_35316/g.88298 Transcript_35316/m.88298 type:complete len:985 (-) Transcript_35316:594-3548(-)